MSQIHTELKELDPAVTPADLDTRSDADAQALLYHIGATGRDSVDAGASTAAPTPRRRPRIARPLIAGTTVAVLAVGLFTFFDSGDGGSQGNVAWAAVPAGVSDDQAKAAANACRSDGGNDSLKTVAVEQRGARIMVMVAGPDEDRLCVLEGTGTDLKVIGATGSSMGAGRDPGDTIKPDEILSSLNGGFTDGAQSVVQASGRVGADVRKVVLDTESQGDVTATVNDGYFVAWWPGELSPEQGASHSQQTVSSATITLADGTERKLSGGQLSSRWTMLLCESEGLPKNVPCPASKP